MENKINTMSQLKEAVKRVIDQNHLAGYHPEIFIFQTKNGEAQNLEEIISDLIRSKTSEEAVVEAIGNYGEVLTIEDLIIKDERCFNLPTDVVLEAKRRAEVYNWYRENN